MRKVFPIYLRLFLFSFPLFFLPIFLDAYGMGKNWLLVAGVLVGLVLWPIDMMVGRKEKINWSKVMLLGLAGGVWALVTFLKEPLGVRINSIQNPLGLGSYMGLLMLAFLWLQVKDDGEKRAQLNWLSVSGAIVAITGLAAFIIPAAKLPLSLPKENPLLVITNGWSLTGSLLAELALMVFLAAEWIKRLVAKLKGGRNDYVIEGMVAAVFVLVGMLDVFKIIKLGWVVLDGQSAWSIAVETFKRNPLFGVGIGNFSQAFELYRPATYNLTKAWNNGFSFANMGLLQIWTETGLVGILLTLFGLSQYLKQKKSFEFWRGLALAAATLLLPLNFLVVFLLVWSAVQVFDKRELAFVWKAKIAILLKFIAIFPEGKVNLVPVGTLLLVLVGAVAGGARWVKLLLAERNFRQSLVAASKNDGTNTYNLQIKAIADNPYSAEYRRVYSQTNMALAGAILNNKEATDEDKQKASVLIQQAVREGKAAIALDNLNANYWTNLAAIYKNLIGLVEGSADWSLQAYQQAAAFDSVNPMIKLDMGGLLYAAQRYEEADRVFEQAVTVKSDYANAWYNWAYSAKQQNKLYDAVQRLSQAVALVPASSGDYEKASKELESWKKEYEEALKKLQEQQGAAQQQAKQPETLKTPEALPTVGAEEKVNVPAADMEPPKATQTNLVPEAKEQSPVPTKTAVPSSSTSVAPTKTVVPTP